MPRGLVVSRPLPEYNDSVYRCKCGREQTAACPEMGYSGGLCEELAERFGWRRIDGKWTCPFCTNNTANLFGLFESAGQ